jgi:deoxyinosine 3'endonuclease (endonuclease V)
LREFHFPIGVRRPVFVSVGHLIDRRAAQQILLACAIRYRLREPTCLADQVVGAPVV